MEFIMRELSLTEERDLCVKALMEIRKNGMSVQHADLIAKTRNYHEYLDKYRNDENWRKFPSLDIILTHDLWLIMKRVLTATLHVLDKEEDYLICNMKLIKQASTVQCDLELYDTGLKVDFQNIFMLISKHRKSGKVVKRFGNKNQVKSMWNSYHLEQGFKL